MRREPLGEGVRQREMEAEGERSNATRVPKIHIVKKIGNQEESTSVQDFYPLSMDNTHD